MLRPILVALSLSAIFHPVLTRVDRIHPDEKQKTLLHQTFKDLLQIDHEQYDDDRDQVLPPRPVTKSARAASKYMRRLFDRYRKHEIGNSGSELEKKSVVRAILPKFGHFQNRQALIFDLESISPTETLVKAEIHYYLGNHHSNFDGSTPKEIHCYILTPSSSQNGKPLRKTDMELPPVPVDDRDESKKWAVFDAMKFLNSTLQSRDDQNNDTGLVKARPVTMAILFARTSGPEGTRLRFSPVRKVLRFHAPFLSVFSQDATGLAISDPVDERPEEEEADDDDDDEDEASDQEDKPADQVRHKRNVDAKYYEYYHPYDTPYTISPNDVGSNWRSMSGHKEEPDTTASTPDFIQRGPSVLRRGGQSSKSNRRSHKKHGRRGSFGRRHQGEYLDDNGAWSPMEHEDPAWGKGRKKKYGKILKAKDGDQNPTTVVLLDGKHDESAIAMTCQRNDLVVDFRDIGWGDYIIAPSSFEAHYCAGSCPFPIPANVNATNHAIVLDIIQKIRLHPQVPKPCCAPDKMDSLSLLYYDANGNVVLTTYPKMSVVSCACL